MAAVKVAVKGGDAVKVGAIAVEAEAAEAVAGSALANGNVSERAIAFSRAAQR